MFQCKCPRLKNRFKTIMRKEMSKIKYFFVELEMALVDIVLTGFNLPPLDRLCSSPYMWTLW
jgi:hypothetical protein